jgi:hypothetical protein
MPLTAAEQTLADMGTVLRHLGWERYQVFQAMECIGDVGFSASTKRKNC